MKSKLFSLALFCLFIFPSAKAQTVDEIVANHVKAIGGSELWTNLKTVKMTGNIDIAPGMKAPFTMYFKDKNKFRFELEIQGLTMIQALDVDSGWNVVPFSGKTDPERMSPEEIKSAKQQADFTGDLFNYKAKGNTIEYLGKEDMEGTETYKLKVTRKNNDITYIYLDAASYLSLKESTKIIMEDKELESSTLPSNYKEVKGLTFPFALEIREGDDATSGQTMTIETIEINPAVDDKIFIMPAVASAVAPSTGDVK